MTNTIATPTISGLTSDASKTSGSKATLGQNFDDFLRLLTTQLQNQDPLAPLDSNEFTNQLVQFSQVEQQINTNQKLDSVVALQLSSSISAALGYVGLDANYISNDMNYDGTTPVKITYSLSGAAASGKLSIVDDEGNTVYTEDIIGKSGKTEFTWDGKNNSGEVQDAGTYTVKIDGVDVKDAKLTSTVVVSGRVRGIETQDGTIYLLVGERAVPVANVLNAAQPKTPTSTTTTT
jgi:flagellar basal-body rod modification protein FlgD